MPSAHLGEVDWKNTIQRKMGITISINPVTQSQPIQINCKHEFNLIYIYIYCGPMNTDNDKLQ